MTASTAGNPQHFHRTMNYAEFLTSHQVMLAPMAGVSDPAFRQICIEHGASLAFTEMVSAKGLSYANARTAHLVDLYDGEGLVGVQIFGHEPHTMAEQAKWIEDALEDHLAVIDINMGCPVRKIAGKGDGAALIKDIALAGAIVEAVVRAVETPVSIKTRRGWDSGKESCIDFARMAESAGAAAMTLHGRFATQMYRGKADWDCIARSKAAVSLPIIGNGDVFSAEDACALLDQTGCNALLVARGAQGNPWIFAQIHDALADRHEGNAAYKQAKVPVYPTPMQRIETARRHAHLLVAHHPKSIVRMRKQASWYVKGLPGASQARAAFNTCSTIEDFDRVFDELEQQLESQAEEHV